MKLRTILCVAYLLIFAGSASAKHIPSTELLGLSTFDVNSSLGEPKKIDGFDGDNGPYNINFYETPLAYYSISFQNDKAFRLSLSPKQRFLFDKPMAPDLNFRCISNVDSESVAKSKLFYRSEDNSILVSVFVIDGTEYIDSVDFTGKDSADLRNFVRF